MTTKRVRIAVAIDRNGKHSAMTVDPERPKPDEETFDWILDELEPGEARYFVDVDLPLPENAEVKVIEATAVPVGAATPKPHNVGDE